jgi:hypothetical protein
VPKQICDPRQARERSPSLDERIARLHRRRMALTQLMDLLTAYAHYAGQESDLTYVCHLHNPPRQLPGQPRSGKPGSTRRPGSNQPKETPTGGVEPLLLEVLVDGLQPARRKGKTT